ncbi:hypothetical protein K504DRAFT_438358 [Pleomassaria siparia CBS 279.74]|uniref:Glyoxalase-like domain-containing protein n=1 Tax=Pleomassaria siparia CBS 279.74 TaxID=1314801 RepID=A0A6G1K165_9PLEO|nr:hypothetical protein K504DRAFT_438358 [Pleomassaria siparia CBS 279.74]
MAAPLPSLDHLILFLPLSSDSTPQIPTSISTAFTLTPGGKHADNLTANTLILLADGCYIELISFLTPDISNHWWGPDFNRRGWADWCLTTQESALENYEGRLKGKEGGGSHVRPRAGGRLRPDGVQVKWSVTFPEGENGGQDKRGRIPFFCHDDPITARHLRVPISEEKTKHDSGALGVYSITVLVKDQETFVATRSVYATILGQEVGEKSVDEAVFQAGRVKDVNGWLGLEGQGALVKLRIVAGEEVEKVKEKGYWFGDVTLGAKAGGGRNAGDRRRVDHGDGEGDVGGVWIEYV